MEKVGRMVGLKVWGGKIGGYSPPVESTRSATALTCCCLHHPPPPQQPHPGGEQEMWQLQPTANQRHTTIHHPPPSSTSTTTTPRWRRGDLVYPINNQPQAQSKTNHNLQPSNASTILHNNHTQEQTGDVAGPINNQPLAQSKSDFIRDSFFITLSNNHTLEDTRGGEQQKWRSINWERARDTFCTQKRAHWS